MASLGNTLRTSGTVGTASAEAFSKLTETVSKRVSVPTDGSVHELLREDIHFLAAALDPVVLDSHASDVCDVVERAFRAIRSFFVRSAAVFSPHQLATLSDDQRVSLLRQQFTAYPVLSGMSSKEAFAARKPSVDMDIASVMSSSWDAWGWWSPYGCRAPELWEI